MLLPELNISKLELLVVDDNAFMRKIVQDVLKALNCYNVTLATDGSDALDSIQTSLPDIIITNWQMKPLDGIEFTRMIRAQTDQPEEMIPVIMLTGYTEAHHVAEARDAGVTEFLAKPISANVLYSRLVSVVMDTRPFVRAPNFTGPCRHRHDIGNYIGEQRRCDDFE